MKAKEIMIAYNDFLFNFTFLKLIGVGHIKIMDLKGRKSGLYIFYIKLT